MNKEKALIRRPLASGNIYNYKGYKSAGFKVLAVAFPGHPEDDGALPGVCIKWLHRFEKHQGWYPFTSEEEFWAHELFRNACDPEHA